MVSNQSVEYGPDAELRAVALFPDYPESLLQFALACCVIFMIIGIPGNLVTIIALASCKKFHNATAFFIINLHINNLIFCCTILPMVSVTYSARRWVLGKTLCSVYALMKYSLNATGLFTVVAITVNRYIMVCHPFMYPRFYKHRNLILSLISTWLAGFALFVPSFFGAFGQFGLDIKGIDCTMIPDKNNVCPKIYFVCFAFAGPYLIISFCYGCIWWTVKKAMKQRNNRVAPPVMRVSDQSVAKNSDSDICREPTTVYESSVDEGINKPNSAVSLTPNGRENVVSKFFKTSFRFTRKDNEALPTRKDKKLATMILAILISFVICHLPLIITRVLYGEYKSNHVANVLAYLLEYCTAIISPIIYVIMSNEYRQAYKSLFKNINSKVMGYYESRTTTFFIV